MSFFAIDKNGIKHIFSMLSWFKGDHHRDIITSFCNRIGEPLTINEKGLPTNDIEWHFDLFPNDMVKALENIEV